MSNQLQTQNKRDISTDTSAWTFQDIKRYYDPQDLLTEKQIGQALSLIKGRNLNPLLNEVYIVAYKKKNGGIHGLVFSEEHKQKMMDELDLYSFIEKLNEYMAFGHQSIMVFEGANNDNIQRI